MISSRDRSSRSRYEHPLLNNPRLIEFQLIFIGNRRKEPSGARPEDEDPNLGLGDPAGDSRLIRGSAERARPQRRFQRSFQATRIQQHHLRGAVSWPGPPALPHIAGVGAASAH